MRDIDTCIPKYAICIPKDALYILEVLNNNRHQAFVVGGCVRDSIMGNVPHDWDITTSAHPDEVKNLFSKTVDTGIKHGTVTVLVNGNSFEVTTFRTEGEYVGFRRPSGVSFTKDVVEDLKRRDFTVNAIAYNDSDGFIDPFDGIGDIQRGIIKCVGDANDRFSEDALRMLRAVRFCAKLDFGIENKTLEAMCNNAELIVHISCERIRDELNKLLLSDNPERFGILKETGMMKYILPEFEICYNTMQNNPYHIYDVAQHSLKAVKSIEKDIELKWAMLLHDIGKPLVKTTNHDGTDHFYGHEEKSFELAVQILERLRFDTKSINRISKLVKYHQKDIEAGYKAVRRALNVMGEDLFADFLKVKEADIRAQNPKYLEPRIKKQKQILDIYEDILKSKQCISSKDLALTGYDLINAGVPQGREIGDIIQRLLDEVIEQPELNNKEALLELVRGWLK